MFSPDYLHILAKEMMERLGKQNTAGSNYNKDRAGSSETSCNKNSTTIGNGKGGLTPAQVLVISGLLGGVLDVSSVLVDRKRTVEIVLTGSLRQKTQLEKVMDQVGSMSFDEVMRTLIDKFTL